MTDLRPTKELLRGMFSYMKWADELLLSAAGAVADDAYYLARGISHGSIHGLLVHCMAAQTVWLKRWSGEPNAAIEKQADYPTRSSIVERWPNVHQSLFSFLDNQTDESLQRPVVARNTYGEQFSVPLGATMLHVVDHASYHRGQLNSMLKQAGVKPTAPYLQRYLSLH
jgi:uncharacterized damage-inducible protein DinB